MGGTERLGIKKIPKYGSIGEIHSKQNRMTIVHNNLF